MKVWLKLADWWSSRSQAKIQQRIDKLQASLTEIEVLPLLSDFEAIVVRGFSLLFGFIAMIFMIGALLYLLLYKTMVSQSGLTPITLAEAISILFGVFTVYTSISLGSLFVNFHRNRTPEYREMLRRHIELLKARL